MQMRMRSAGSLQKLGLCFFPKVRVLKAHEIDFFAGK